MMITKQVNLNNEKSNIGGSNIININNRVEPINKIIHKLIIIRASKFLCYELNT